MLLTFTRRAAREMLQRTRALVPMPAGSGGVLGGTFHSVAHRFLRLHASALDLAPGFGVLDAGDAADLIDMVREEHGHAQSKRRFPKKSTLLDIYSRTVNAQQPLAGVVAEHFPWCEEHGEAMAALFKAYTARKRALGVLDLDDLLLYWRALAADEVIGPAMEQSFDHLLIDEYQDVNGLQVDIVRALRGARRDVTAVGDDFQAIYGWRAASAEHILQFPHSLPRRGRGHARAQLPLHAADPRCGQRGGGAGEPRVPEAAAHRTRRWRPARPRLLPRRGCAGHGRVRPRAGSARAGHGPARAGGAESHVTRHRPAGAGAHAPAHPLCQVRRTALPRGRARQGLHRAAAPGGQPGATRSPGSGCFQLLEGVGPATARRTLDRARGGRRWLVERAGTAPLAGTAARRRAHGGAVGDKRRQRAPARGPSGCATRSRR